MFGEDIVVGDDIVGEDVFARNQCELRRLGSKAGVRHTRSQAIAILGLAIARMRFGFLVGVRKFAVALRATRCGCGVLPTNINLPVFVN